MDSDISGSVNDMSDSWCHVSLASGDYVGLGSDHDSDSDNEVEMNALVARLGALVGVDVKGTKDVGQVVDAVEKKLQGLSKESADSKAKAERFRELVLSLRNENSNLRKLTGTLQDQAQAAGERRVALRMQRFQAKKAAVQLKKQQNSKVIVNQTHLTRKVSKFRADRRRLTPSFNDGGRKSHK